MNFRILLVAASVLCAAPVWAQPDPIIKPPNGLPFPLVSPADAEKLALVKPIKLDLKNVTVAAALEELQTQSGVELNLENVNYSKRTLAKRVSVKVETRSFNQAFDAIMDAAGLKANLRNDNYNQPPRVDFNRYQSSDRTGPQFVQGMFGVRLSQLITTLAKTVDLRQAKLPSRSERNVLSAYMMLLPDLRLPLVGAARPRLTRADDDQGRSLLVAKDENNRNDVYGFYNNGYRQSQVNLELRAPESDAKSLAHLEGVVVYSIVTKTELWEVPDLLSQPEWKRAFANGEQTFEMTIKPKLSAKGDAQGGQPGNLRLAIEVTSNRRAQPDEISPPMLAGGAVIAALKIVDANGVVLRVNGSGGDNNDGKMTTQATFYIDNNYDDGGKPKPLAMPLKLSFEAPLYVVQTEAPFSFENLALREV